MKSKNIPNKWRFISMKKTILMVLPLFLVAFLFSCGSAEESIIEQTPVPFETSVHVPISTQEPILEPTPEPITIEVKLNNSNLRYVDDKETKYDITVTGNINSYEILFLPSELPFDNYKPELDENGFPKTEGLYIIAVEYNYNDISDIYESKTFVRLINRPTVKEQLTTTSKIPTHLNWELEYTIVEKNSKIEGDKHI